VTAPKCTCHMEAWLSPGVGGPGPYPCMNSRHFLRGFSPHPTLDLRWMPKLLWGPTNNSLRSRMLSGAERVGRTGEVRGERSVTDSECGRCAPVWNCRRTSNAWRSPSGTAEPRMNLDRITRAPHWGNVGFVAGS
jgi:hypothetical protein